MVAGWLLSCSSPTPLGNCGALLLKAQEHNSDHSKWHGVLLLFLFVCLFYGAGNPTQGFVHAKLCLQPTDQPWWVETHDLIFENILCWKCLFACYVPILRITSTELIPTPPCHQFSNLVSFKTMGHPDNPLNWFALNQLSTFISGHLSHEAKWTTKDIAQSSVHWNDFLLLHFCKTKPDWSYNAVVIHFGWC
jgi:hypothetical protein